MSAAVREAWEFYRDNCTGFKEPMRRKVRELDEYVSRLEATLVRGTCRVEDYEDAGIGVCSACGAVQPDDYTVYYCWNCGSKVVEE